MNHDILYSNGHKCEKNGTGDYRFVCPSLGRVGGFLPFMFRTSLGGKCKCGDKVSLLPDKQQPSYNNTKGMIKCRKCGSSKIHSECVEVVNRITKPQRGWDFYYYLVAQCIECDHKTSLIPYIKLEKDDDALERLKQAMDESI